jgi:hypothetical protein
MAPEDAEKIDDNRMTRRNFFFALAAAGVASGLPLPTGLLAKEHTVSGTASYWSTSSHDTVTIWLGFQNEDGEVKWLFRQENPVTHQTYGD